VDLHITPDLSTVDIDEENCMLLATDWKASVLMPYCRVCEAARRNTTLA
jgi:hypothetical protein